VPAKNSLKDFEENGYYHIYSRGVEKRLIFLDSQDYGVFLSYLKFYLSPVEEDLELFPSKRLKNYFNNIDLLCYCLMPNHFHFFVRQNERTGITDFTRSLLTRYSMYFNKRYKRSGSLFQGRYKAVKVESEAQFVYLTKYIHRNPSELVPDLLSYKYSSLSNYLGNIKQNWLKPGQILDLFSKTNSRLSYKSFVYDLFEAGGIDVNLCIDLE